MNQRFIITINMKPAILWFRRDLRLNDNLALIAAAESGRPVIPVYVIDEQDTGGASRWWLHWSLDSLASDLEALGTRLIVRDGLPPEALAGVAEELDAGAIFFSRRYEPRSRVQERALDSLLGERLDIVALDDAQLIHPRTLLTGNGNPYKIFTPFWRAAVALEDPPSPQAAANKAFMRHSLDVKPLADFGLLPSGPDWSTGLQETWTPGEAAALDRIDALESIAAGYARNRDRPDLDASSRLSPHLHFGEISVRQAWHALNRLDVHANMTQGAEALQRQLYWREFSRYLLLHFPDLPDKPLRTEFDDFPWRRDGEGLSAWQRGQTGFPIVDAGMRQLWHTGWMHNRVRMIVASFLVKNLMVPWQAGAEWFMDTLVDADLANNSASWQWVAGCGTDATPYFRIFNPVLQGRKFDPDGSYVRRWVPELAERNDSGVHEPEAGAIVDHGAARIRALEAYQSLKGSRASKQAPRSVG